MWNYAIKFRNIDDSIEENYDKVSETCFYKIP